jgi:membrane protein implicated in regulation of membrane protease activity
MKHLKKIFAALVLGFFAFAPPGTLIFIGVLLLSLLGKTWFMVGVFLGSVALAVYAFIYREKLLKTDLVKNISQRFKK